MGDRETVLVRTEPRSYEAGPAYDVLMHGEKIARIARHRHTYRTTYTGTRIGYDRKHFCWWGDRAITDPWGTAGLRCYPTRASILAALLAGLSA